MFKKIIAAVILSSIWLTSSFASSGKNFELRWQQGYRYDLRRSDYQLYINRVSCVFTRNDKQDKELLKLEPFFEIRRNTDKGIWERKELGVEIGRGIFPWFYLAQGIQAVWLKENYLDYTSLKGRDSVESETRLLFTHNFFPNSRMKLKGFALDEYTYDFDMGAAVRNELALGLSVALNKHMETAINWRHIDLIHDYDADAVEASITLIF